MTYASGILGISMAVNLAIGVAVYLANPRRGQNLQFLVFSTVMSVWGTVVLGISFTRDSHTANLLIRFASYFSVLIPVAFHLLCLSIEHTGLTFRGLLYKARKSIVASQVAGFLCFLPPFLVNVVIPETNAASTLPEAKYGPLYPVYAIYYPVIMGIIVYGFIRSVKKATGIQREELRFIVLGMCVTVALGMTTNAIIPAVSGTSGSQIFGPISIVAMNAIIAYGIATRRIMDVAYVLRRAAAYTLLTVYLVTLYLVIWLATDSLVGRFTDTQLPIGHLLAALALAFSVTPAHGLLQRFANRLFLTGQTMDVGGTVSELHDMLQAIRTMPNLLQRFSQTIAGSIGTDSVTVMLRNHEGFQQKYPAGPNGSGAHFAQTDPLVQELAVAREPIVADELSRLRPTPKVKTIGQRLANVDAAVAVGIRTSDQLDGILLLGPKVSGRIYGAVELDALPILCDQLGIALENAELYTQTRDGKIYNEVLLDNLTSGVIAANVSGRITVINREAQRITGLAPRDVVDQPIETLPAPLATALQQTFATGQGLRDQDFAMPGSDGERIPIRIGSSVFTGHTGNMLGALVVFTDLTTIKKLETQVRRTDRLASIGTLAAGMAHEIKNPLVTVKTFTQLLPERYQDEEFRGTFSTLIGQEVKRIDSIVNQLLKFARPAKPDLAPVHLHAVVGDCVRLIEQQLKQKGISLEEKLNAPNDAMLADANMLQQAFINFFLNAIDSMESGGTLTVSTAALRYDRRRQQALDVDHPLRVRLTIQDTGKGIDPEDLSHIFDPFFTTKGHGTGLGLSVSHGIIQDHGGDIDVESEPGKGTAFHVVFPLRVEEPVT